MRELDIILFGATGFTGKHALPFVAKFSKAKNPQLTWGIAGRSATKLKELLTEYDKDTGTSLSNIPTIVANIDDETSISAMVRKARIIINCCGPYRFYGEQVVKACVEEGTHHVDISGELYYMENMQLKYDALAREKGIYIISACGFDSIPADLGVVFLQQQFEGTLNSVDTYLTTWTEGHFKGSALNYGTWESAINGMAHANDVVPVRKKLFTTPLPICKPKVPMINRPHKNKDVKGWILPFPGADRSVVQRSQYLFYEKDKQRPIQIGTYFTVSSFWTTILAILFGLMLRTLTKFKQGTKLLLKYPGTFSGGLFTQDPPSEEQINNSHFKFVLRGEGWKEKQDNPDHQYTSPPDSAVCVKVQGRNPGYGSTCISLVLAGITILTEADKMPAGGGVYPPGYAFAKTSLIEQLNVNEVTFELLYNKLKADK